MFERRWRALLSSPRIIQLATGPDGVIRFTEGGGLATMGFAAGQNVGHSIYELYRDEPWILEGFRRALAGEAGGAMGTMRGVWFSIQYIPLFDESGKVEEVVGIATNIQDMRESEERYQRLASATFEAVAIHDRGVIVDANLAMAELFGYAPTEIVGMNALDFCAPESREVVRAHIASGSGEPYEGVGLRKDGSTFPGEIRGRTLTGGRFRVTCIRDITDKKRLLDAEKAARAAAEDGLDLREEFLSIASHELNSPLTALNLQLGQAAAMLREGGIEVESLSRSLEVSLRQTRRLTRLVGDLLDASRIRTGRLSLQREDVDLAEVAKEALEHLSHEVARSRSTVELFADQPVRGHWDRQRIEQVVLNLITNALNYGQGKPITIRVEPGGLLTVEDHGAGIALDETERIFERYERAARRPGGLGLGLYITKQIITAHGGTIRVESKVGHGSLFTVELPP